MTTITKIDGVKYVERNYKCYDCQHTWSQVTTEHAPLQECPNCANNQTKGFGIIPDNEKVKHKKKLGPKVPTKKTEKWNPAGGKAPGYSNGLIMKAANMAFEEAQKQGATDMMDTNIREGDISAPKINNAVTHTLEKGFGMTSGWTGNSVPMGAILNRGDSAGATALGELQSGLMSGQRPDMLRQNLVQPPKNR